MLWVYFRVSGAAYFSVLGAFWVQVGGWVGEVVIEEWRGWGARDRKTG